MRHRTEQSAYKLGLRYLTEAPDGLTAQELTEQLGIAKRTTLAYIKVWKEEGKIRIADWRRFEGRGGDMVPVYALVSSPGQKDKRKPAASTKAENQARYRERMGPIIRARRRLRRTGDAIHMKMLLEGVTRK